MKLKKNKTETGFAKTRSVKGFVSLVSVAVLGLPIVFGLACQPNTTILKDVAPPATPMSTAEVKRTSVEQDLQEMRANFDFIYVFRRKDGAVFDNDDRKYLRQNTPLETNKFLSSDDGRAFIAGAGFTFMPEQIAALQKRFVVEDYSKPEAKELAKQQANSNRPSNANTANANVNSRQKEK